jgi:hypothetical protein
VYPCRKYAAALIKATHGEGLKPRTIDKWRDRYLNLGQLLDKDQDGQLRALWSSVNWAPRAFVYANFSSIEDYADAVTWYRGLPDDQRPGGVTDTDVRRFKELQQEAADPQRLLLDDKEHEDDDDKDLPALESPAAQAALAGNENAAAAVKSEPASSEAKMDTGDDASMTDDNEAPPPPSPKPKQEHKSPEAAAAAPQQPSPGDVLMAQYQEMTSRPQPPGVSDLQHQMAGFDLYERARAAGAPALSPSSFSLSLDLTAAQDVQQPSAVPAAPVRTKTTVLAKRGHKSKLYQDAATWTAGDIPASIPHLEPQAQLPAATDRVVAIPDQPFALSGLLPPAFAMQQLVLDALKNPHCFKRVCLFGMLRAPFLTPPTRSLNVPGREPGRRIHLAL